MPCIAVRKKLEYVFSFAYGVVKYEICVSYFEKKQTFTQTRRFHMSSYFTWPWNGQQSTVQFPGCWLLRSGRCVPSSVSQPGRCWWSLCHLSGGWKTRHFGPLRNDSPKILEVLVCHSASLGLNEAYEIPMTPWHQIHELPWLLPEHLHQIIGTQGPWISVSDFSRFS